MAIMEVWLSPFCFRYAENSDVKSISKRLSMLFSTFSICREFSINFLKFALRDSTLSILRLSLWP